MAMALSKLRVMTIPRKIPEPFGYAPFSRSRHALASGGLLDCGETVVNSSTETYGHYKKVLESAGVTKDEGIGITDVLSTNNNLVLKQLRKAEEETRSKFEKATEKTSEAIGNAKMDVLAIMDHQLDGVRKDLDGVRKDFKLDLSNTRMVCYCVLGISMVAIYNSCSAEPVQTIKDALFFLK